MPVGDFALAGHRAHESTVAAEAADGGGPRSDQAQGGGPSIAGFRVNDDGGARLRAYLREPVDAAPGATTDVTVGLTRLCIAAARELELLAVTVTLIASPGSETPVAFSDNGDRWFDELQFNHGEGPTLEAFATRSPVMETDMAGAIGRWPGFAGAASGAGIGAAFAYPLQLGAARFGVLMLYAGTTRTLDAYERSQCLIFCDLLVELLIDGSTGSIEDRLDPGLEAVLEMRTEVYQAQGMVMADLGVSLAEALARMRAFAFADGRGLNDLAIEIVARRVRLPRDLGPGA